MRYTVNVLIGVTLPSWWEALAIRRYRQFASANVELIGSCLNPEQRGNTDAGGLVAEVANNGRNAEREGAQVHILDCFGDPDLEELRAQLTAPVVGVGQSAMIASSVWYRRFAVITSEIETEQEIERNAAKYGVLSQYGGCRAIGIPAAQIPSRREEALAALIPHAQELAAEGAEAVILGCTELALMAAELQAVLRSQGSDVQAVNPIAVAQRWAEMALVSGPQRAA